MATGAKETAAELSRLLAPAVAAAGLDLEEITVSRAGNRSVVRIAVDRDGGVDLDAVAAATRAINDILDAHEDVIAGAYALEVGSPGVDRPLTLPRHWRRAVGRLVTVNLLDGAELTGRVMATTEDGATLQVGDVATMVSLDGVRRAMVQVEFSRPAGTTAHEQLSPEEIDAEEIDAEEIDDEEIDDEDVDTDEIDEDEEVEP